MPKGIISLITCMTALVALAACSSTPSTPQNSDGIPTIETESGSDPAEDSKSTDGIWISRSEIDVLPMTGVAWENVFADAQRDTRSPKLQDGNSNNDVYTYAKALVYARTGKENYRTEVRETLKMVIDSLEIHNLNCGDEHPAPPLPVGRNVAAYVLAADIIKLEDFPEEDAVWRQWLDKVRCIRFTGDGPIHSFISADDQRPNNWGLMLGVSRIAIAAYLDDHQELDQAAGVLRGWLGDSFVYAGFDYGAVDWQCDETLPVGINPMGCMKEDQDGILRDISGVLGDDQRRCEDAGCNDDDGRVVYPFPKENYVWEALQAAAMKTWLLFRAGHDLWDINDQAMVRAMDWLYTPHFAPSGHEPYLPEGNDRNTPWLVNCAEGTHYDIESPTTPARNMGYNDWTHAPDSPLCQ